MRDTIKKILKENRDYHASVFLIMSEDEKFVRYNLHVAGENYFTGGPNGDVWESIDNLNDKTFREFYVNQRKNAEGVISILPQKQLDTYKPKVVEYIMGYFRKDDMNNVFDQLSESIENDYVLFIGSENSKGWHDNFTEGNSYPFRWDEEDDAYWVKDNVDSWRPFSRNFFDNNFSKYDYNQTNNMFESEDDDFGWIDPPNEEPFHKTLMKGERRRPRLMDEIKTIMFNPPVEIGSQRFNKIAYWLEDHDYYPEDLKLEGRTSYIEIIKQRGANNIRNGRYRLGPELSTQELYELSQTVKNGWNYNFWEDEFIARFYDKEMPD